MEKYQAVDAPFPHEVADNPIKLVLEFFLAQKEVVALGIVRVAKETLVKELVTVYLAPEPLDWARSEMVKRIPKVPCRISRMPPRVGLEESDVFVHR